MLVNFIFTIISVGILRLANFTSFKLKLRKLCLHLDRYSAIQSIASGGKCVHLTVCKTYFLERIG